MAGSFSNYLENALLNHIFKKGSFSQPTNLYIGLSTVDPGESAGGLAEPSAASGYSRTLMNDWIPASTGAVMNSGVVTFSTATGPWGMITHFGLFDASTNGNMLAYANLTVPKSPTSGDIVTFASGSIVIGLD